MEDMFKCSPSEVADIFSTALESLLLNQIMEVVNTAPISKAQRTAAIIGAEDALRRVLIGLVLATRKSGLKLTPEDEAKTISKIAVEASALINKMVDALSEQKIILPGG